MLNKLVAPRHAGAHARIIDLIWHLPVGVIDRAVSAADFRGPKIGELATLEVTVTEHRRGGRTPRRARAPIGAGRGCIGRRLELVYFNADPAYLKRLLPDGSRRLISGKLESYNGWLQMPHPDHVVAIGADKNERRRVCPLHEPLYPADRRPLQFGACARRSARRWRGCPPLPEWIDKALRERNAWPIFRRCALAVCMRRRARPILTLASPVPDAPWLR